MREVFSTFEPLAVEKEVTLELESTSTLPPVFVDPSRIRQVFHNLVSNALRHTPSRGKIIIHCATMPHEIRVSVSDTGPGIPAEHIQYVFDRFYRIDPSRSRETGGTGLGLAIVKAIVEVHHGNITAHSPGINSGTTFTVHLPIEGH